MTGAAYVEVKKAIVMFKENCERTLIEIKTMIYTQIVGGTSGSTDRQDEYNELNGKIFQLVNLTIREVPEMASIRKYGAKKAFEKGIEYLKHIYDTLGQGGTSNAAVYTAPPCDLHRTDLEDHGGSMLDELGLVQWLGEDVGRVVVGRDSHNFDITRLLVVVEEVHASVNMFSALARVEVLG